MSEIILKSDHLVLTTQIPNYFIDHFMTSANGEFVKVYLYLLRCVNHSDNSFSISKAADKFEHTEKDIYRALKYWEKMGLLHLEYTDGDTISGIYFLDFNTKPKKVIDNSSSLLAAPPTLSADPKAPVHKKTAPAIIEPKNYSQDELKNFREKEDIQELIFITEQYLGRTLNSTDLHTLLFWYDQLSLKVDIIEYLIEYCVGKGHKSIHYMNKVAISWSNSQVKTIEDAKKNSYEYSRLHYAVIKALGIKGRNLIPAEISYIEKWSKNLAFTDEIIMEACKRTIMAVHEPRFDYTDGILEKWHQSKIRHLTDIIELDESFHKSKTPQIQKKTTVTNKFNNFTQRTYDFENLEKKLVKNTNQAEST